MSDKNETGIRLKCLELAVLSLNSFPGIEVHKLALKYQHFIETNEWVYDIVNPLNDEYETEEKRD